MKLCALVEFNICHDELFPSIVKILNQKGFVVHIFTKRQNIVKNSLYFSKGFKYRFFKIRYWNFIKRLGIYDNIIFNSFEDYRDPKQSFIVKEISSSKSKNKPRVLVHDAKNLVDELDRGLLMNFVPVVISEHGDSLLRSKNIESEILFPYYYGDFVNKFLQKEKVIFSVQGNFSNNRRNYQSLFSAVSILSKMSEFKDKFIVKFVGRNDTEDAKKFKSLLGENDLSAYFDFCEDVSTYRNFFSEINNSDYIIPLVDDSCEELSKYFKSVSSSSVNIAIAMAKPLVINEKFAENYYKFKESMLEYEGVNVLDGMMKAMRLSNENYGALVDNITRVRISEDKKKSLLNK